MKQWSPSSGIVFSRLQRLSFVLLFCLPMNAVVYGQGEAKPQLTLQGTVRAPQNQTYLSVPFEVPRDVHRITLSLAIQAGTRKRCSTWASSIRRDFEAQAAAIKRFYHQ